MAVAVVQEWTTTDRETPRFDAVSAEIRRRTGGMPDGMLFHCAGFDGDTFRVFSAWESRDQFDRFRDEVILPAVQAVAPGGEEPQTHSYELQAVAVPEGRAVSSGA